MPKDKISSRPYVPVTYGESIRTNTKKINYIHDICSLVMGTVAGILNLESLHGFGFFFGASFLVDLVIYVLAHINSGGSTSNYFQHPIKEIFLVDYSRSVFSFIMMWTLVVCLIST
ncbi:hypothetical protein DASC09_024990 [Saccharomycopsis crataegensis]|uniref:ER membrane protein complex subunit 6 n=1 Tax=Saccharomycopsis crataegensis TaxID=43959 RepID=A0AAV5QL64_9ASCO|nr:hypothetical protein DASC09_024990 [Saccharomycopsis crataegensis]